MMNLTKFNQSLLVASKFSVSKNTYKMPILTFKLLDEYKENFL